MFTTCLEQFHLTNAKLENICGIEVLSIAFDNNQVTTFPLDTVKCGVAICYDINFDDFIKFGQMEGNHIALSWLQINENEKKQQHKIANSSISYLMPQHW